MGVRLVVDPEGGSDSVAMYDSVSGWAFGPVFSSADDAEAFLDYLEQDARHYRDNVLREKYGEWLKSRREAPA